MINEGHPCKLLDFKIWVREIYHGWYIHHIFINVFLLYCNDMQCNEYTHIGDFNNNNNSFNIWGNFETLNLILRVMESSGINKDTRVNY
jgi:hypothetical protein